MIYNNTTCILYGVTQVLSVMFFFGTSLNFRCFLLLFLLNLLNFVRLNTVDSLVRAAKIPNTKVRLLLAHGSNFGQMPFLPPPATHMDTMGVELRFAGYKSFPLNHWAMAAFYWTYCWYKCNIWKLQDTCVFQLILMIMLLTFEHVAHLTRDCCCGGRQGKPGMLMRLARRQKKLRNNCCWTNLLHSSSVLLLIL